MKPFRLFLFLVLCLVSVKRASAQDTTVVQTLTYDSIGRDGFYHFPDSGSFEKVVLQYSMRCHGARISQGVQGHTEDGCGQWDYNCETFLWDSTRTDSLRNKWPSHIISAWPQYTNFPYTTQKTYSVTRRNEKVVSYSPGPVLSPISTGKDSGSVTEPFGGSVSRSLFLYKASELAIAGMKRGPIGAIVLNNSDGFAGVVHDLRIRMRLVKSAALSESLTRDTGFVEVYRNTTTIASANNTLYFYRPINWDSISDIAVEISHTEHSTDFPFLAISKASNTGASLFSTLATDALSFGGSEYITLQPQQFRAISKEITVAFWAYGDSTRIPSSNTVFLEGLDTANRRQLNIHLPWSDNGIYWDCGADSTGNFDRINKTAKKLEITNRWNHWAFTKNATTGKMAIYLNGSLWMSDTGKHRSIDIRTMSLGMAMSSSIGYYGDVRQFALYKNALDSNSIRALMLQDSIIPTLNGIVCYYPMDDHSGEQVSDHVTGRSTPVIGGAVWHPVRGAELPNNYTLGRRANITFLTSSTPLSPTVTDRYTYDSLPNHASSVVRYRIGSNYGFHMNDTVVVIDTEYGKFLATKTYTFNEQGRKVDSVNVPAKDTIRPTALRYFSRAPQKFELMSFVTPYGINLDLGKTGTMWQFDVTDYLPVMRGWKRLTMERGAGQEEFDLRFLFIKGTPTRNVIDMQQVWPMTEENFQTIRADDRYEPRKVLLDPSAKGFKLLSYITGHGQQGEFEGQTHDILVNSTKYRRLVWKECSSNPLYPQGGTWPLNRAGWCPGAATDLKAYEITSTVTPGDSVTMDYTVEGGSGDSRYDPSTQLVTYGAPNFQEDAAIEAIWRPSTRIEYARFNPVCDLPVAVLKNNGSKQLDSVAFEYFVDGGPHDRYMWHGKLLFTDTVSVALPVDSLGFWTLTDTSTFHVAVIHVNAIVNSVDEYAQNDQATSKYIRPPSYEGIIVANTFMNNDPGSYSLHVTNMSGKEIFLRDDFDIKTTYFDSLILPVGCYTIRMDDANEEGLSFWADTSLGKGSLRLRQTAKNGKVLKTFNPDFGKFTQMDFAITKSSAAVNSGSVSLQRISLYPNPAHDHVRIELDGYVSQMITIEIIDDRGLVCHREQRFTNDAAGLRADIDLKQLAHGSYFLRLTTNEGSMTQPLSIQ